MSEAKSTEQQPKKRKGILNRFLDMIEWTGNKLPDPVMIFVGLCALILVASTIASALGARATHPASGEVIEAVNLLNGENIGRILSEAARNFGTFPALGMVLVVMLGVGVAERSGWFEVMLQSAVVKAPKFLIIPSIALIGLLGNLAGDAAPIVLPPLAAMIFIKMGWHPIAGIALAYAAAVGGFAANFFIGMSDALVQAFTQPAAELIDPDIQTNVAMNWYFIAASVIVLLPIIWFITSRVTVPRLGKYDNPELGSEVINIEPHQQKGLLWANISVVLVTLLVVVLAIPEGSFLRNAETGSLVTDSPLLNGIGLLLAIWFFVPGLVYGIVSRTVKNSGDVSRMMVDSMGSMANFIVIVFFAAQMLAYFGWSNLGTIIAIKGAELLEGQSGIVIIIGIIVISAFINLFIGSASAKWAILAPIFVPMMMLLGYHPAFTQMVYRIGDGITNPITPMFPYFALVLSYAQRYDKKIGIGTFIATLVPYSLAMGVGWTVMMIIWYLLGWPVGIDGPIFLPGN